MATLRTSCFRFLVEAALVFCGRWREVRRNDPSIFSQIRQHLRKRFAPRVNATQQRVEVRSVRFRKRRQRIERCQDLVALGLVDGVPLFGDKSLASVAQTSPPCDTLSTCSRDKFLCVASSTSSTNKFNQSFADIKAALDDGLASADSLTPDGWNFSPLAPLFKCP
jgi:hypothetical protein